ncbi:MAG: hypothetical protein J0H43_09575, partial [Actinobacteria bacterium]|nr:hypothetical protein [Actinomycetota bacterium]
GHCALSMISDHGARIVGPPVTRPQVTILASGSEVELAVTAAEQLSASGVPTRTVSVPWRERLAALDPAARAQLTGNPALTVAMESGVPEGWAALTGSGTRTLGVQTFGASGPGEQVRDHVGLTAAALCELVRREQALLQDRVPDTLTGSPHA